MLNILIRRNDLTEQDWALVLYNASDDRRRNGKTYEKLLLDISERARNTAPFVAFDAVQHFASTEHHDAYQAARDNLIQKKGVSEHHAIKRRLQDDNIGLKDKEGLLKLGRHLYRRANRIQPSDERTRLYIHARDSFNSAGYTGQERINCTKYLLTTDISRELRESFSCTRTEMFETGLAIVDENPLKALDLLECFVTEHADVAAIMRTLSENLESEGHIKEAYMAESKSDRPRKTRIDRFRQKIITACGKVEDERLRCPFEFYQTSDHEGIEKFFNRYKKRMDLRKQYELACDIENKTGNQEYADQCRREIISKGFSYALHRFRFPEDIQGMDMLREHLIQEAPGLREHGNMVTELLGMQRPKEQ
jgi:hypothetical protein